MNKSDPVNTVDYNVLVPLKYRKKLNSQRNQLQVSEQLIKDRNRVDMYRYIIGLGEKHFKAFGKDIEWLHSRYPWIKTKQVKFILSELIINTQFSLLREFVRKVPQNEVSPAFFYVTIFVNQNFFIGGIEEYGDYFDYQTYLQNKNNFVNFYFEDQFSDLDVRQDTVHDITAHQKDAVKIILTRDHRLVIPDSSNMLALPIIENATGHDFYISSFYKNNTYLWKKIHFRVENDATI